MLQIDKMDSVSEIVTRDYRTADVFKQHGINYCCGGNVPLEEACANKHVDYDLLMKELQRATMTICLPNNLQYQSWKADFLIEYVTHVHHAYLKATLPSLEAQLISFASSHARRYPELEDILSIFQQLSTLISTYNMYEEEVIFPYIKQIESMHLKKESYGSLFVRTLRKPLGGIIREQSKMTDIMDLLRRKTNNYEVPEKGCTNHTVIYQKLKELESDLLQHKHLENEVLFPKAMEMEKELLHL